MIFIRDWASIYGHFWNPFLRQPFSVETLSTMGWNGGSWPLKSSSQSTNSIEHLCNSFAFISNIAIKTMWEWGNDISKHGISVCVATQSWNFRSQSHAPLSFQSMASVSPHTRLRQTSRKGGIFVVEEVSQPEAETHEGSWWWLQSRYRTCYHRHVARSVLTCCHSAT